MLFSCVWCGSRAVFIFSRALPFVPVFVSAARSLVCFCIAALHNTQPVALECLSNAVALDVRVPGGFGDFTREDLSGGRKGPGE